MAAGAMPIRKLLGIVAQVAKGLAKAHSAGIVTARPAHSQLYVVEGLK